MSDTIYTQGCPFCHSEVVLEGRRLVHAAPVCERYRAWIDAGKAQHRAAVDAGNALELLDVAAENQLTPEGLVRALESDAASWNRLVSEVASTGITGASDEQLTQWIEELERLGAPQLARAIRKEKDGRSDA